MIKLAIFILTVTFSSKLFAVEQNKIPDPIGEVETVQDLLISFQMHFSREI